MGDIFHVEGVLHLVHDAELVPLALLVAVLEELAPRGLEGVIAVGGSSVVALDGVGGCEIYIHY